MAKGQAAADVHAMLERIDDSIRRTGAVPRKDFSSLKRHLSLLAAHLDARGYEVGTTIRRPLEAQLLDLTMNGFVPLKGIEKRLVGASAREVKTAIDRLVGRRGLALVVRESGVGLAPIESDPIERSDLEELLRCLSKMQRLVRRATSKKGSSLSVLREDLLTPLHRWLPSPVVPAKEGEPRDANIVETLAREIRRRALEHHLPIRVPDLLRAMGATAEEGSRALLDGAARGLFDLEPESGMGRLSREDAALCPTGPMGTRLSWVVVREKQGSN